MASVRCARPGAPRHLPSPLAVLGPTLASPREPGPWREVFIWEELDRHLSPFPLLSLCLSVCVFHSFPSLLSSSFPPSFSLPSIPVSPILFFLFSFFFSVSDAFSSFFFLMTLSLVPGDKDPYSQSYGFSSSHVWMLELDHKEG